MTSSSYSSQRLKALILQKNYLSFLDFTRNYEQTRGIFVPLPILGAAYTAPNKEFYTDLGLYQQW